MTVQYPVLIIRGGIFGEVLDDVRECVSDMKAKHLFVVIESGGGIPSDGYRIARLLQSKFDRITCLVPAEAYSTATLIALGCDEIYMHKSACLGPLDTQIPHPNDGGMISSLEIRDTLNTLAGFTRTYAQSFSDMFDESRSMQIGKKDAVELAMKSAVELVRPIVEKIDPINLQKSSRSSRIGQKYAENLLRARMMRDNPKLAEQVSIYLANYYDYHGYAIVLEEAISPLSLNAHDLADLNEWSEISKIYEKSPKIGVQIDNFYVAVDEPEQPKKPQTETKQTPKVDKKKEGGK